VKGPTTRLNEPPWILVRSYIRGMPQLLKECTGAIRVPFLELGGPIEEARTTLVIVSMKVVVLTSLVFSLMSSSA